MGDRWGSWRHPVLEGLAVLAGILIAFAVDASWDSHVERQREDAHLAALADALDATERDLPGILAYLDLHDARVVRLLSEAGSYSGNPLVIDSLLIALGPYAAYAPPMSAFDDLEGTGTLATIESIELRLAIIGYRSRVESFARVQDGLSIYWRTEVMPYWDERTNVRRLVQIASTQPLGEFLVSDLPAVSLEPAYGALLRDRRFLNQLSTWSLQIARIRRSLVELEKEMSSLRRLIESP